MCAFVQLHLGPYDVLVKKSVCVGGGSYCFPRRGQNLLAICCYLWNAELCSWTYMYQRVDVPAIFIHCPLLEVVVMML